MRDSLPFKPFISESGIINLDDSHGEGTHWVCYRKVGLDVYYFDSYGNLPPPKEFVNYMNDIEIFYNRSRVQQFDSFLCGHLCLLYLCQ